MEVFTVERDRWKKIIRSIQCIKHKRYQHKKNCCLRVGYGRIPVCIEFGRCVGMKKKSTMWDKGSPIFFYSDLNTSLNKQSALLCSALLWALYWKYVNKTEYAVTVHSQVTHMILVQYGIFCCNFILCNKWIEIGIIWKY